MWEWTNILLFDNPLEVRDLLQALPWLESWHSLVLFGDISSSHFDFKSPLWRFWPQNWDTQNIRSGSPRGWDFGWHRRCWWHHILTKVPLPCYDMVSDHTQLEQCQSTWHVWGQFFKFTEAQCAPLLLARIPGVYINVLDFGVKCTPVLFAVLNGPRQL